MRFEARARENASKQLLETHKPEKPELRRTFLATRVLLVALSAVVFFNTTLSTHTTRERSERLATKKVSLSDVGMW